jgi:PAS domain S-box-containing protein
MENVKDSFLERLEAEISSLREENARLRQALAFRNSDRADQAAALVDSLPALICRFTPEGVLTFVNEAYCAYFQKKREDLIGFNFFEFIPPEEREGARASFLALTPDNPAISYEHKVIAPDGSERWQRWTDRALFVHGKALEYVSIGEDVTAQKENHARLQFIAIVLDQISDMVTVTDTRGVITYVNAAVCRFLGKSAGELAGQTSAVFGDDPQNASSPKEILERTLRDGQWRGEVVSRRADGAERIMDVRTSMVLGTTGAPIALCGIGTDVTDKRRANEALHASEARFRLWLESAPEGVFVQAQGCFAYLNRAMAALLGAASELELIGAPVVPRLHPDYREIARERIRVLNQEKRHVPRMEQIWLRLDGTTFYAEVSAVPVRHGDSDGALVFVRDVSERKKAEAALRESELKLSSIFENLDLGVALIGPDHKVLEANRKLKEWFPGLDLAQQPVCHRIFQDPPADSVCDGCPVEKTFATGQRSECVKSFHAPNDEEIQRRRVITCPVPDVDGKVAAVIEIIEDVTEKMFLEERLRQAQKMEAVGQLAGGVAHDFNNMLTVILGNTDLASAGLDLGDDIQPLLDEIQRAAIRAAYLTRQLLAFSRRQVIRPEVLDLNGKIAELLKMLRRVISENNVLRFIPGNALPPVRVDPVQLDQVLLNLCVNARDAMPEGGGITIETGGVLVDEAMAAAHPGVEPGLFAILSVTDTGTGIAPENMPRIFEPFYTTKEPGSGTGLGLATVHGIVSQHRGMIHVYSEPGAGTVFRVYLPAAEPAGAGQEDFFDAPVQGGSETLLVAEDDEMVRNMAGLMLEMAGYTVFAAKDGIEALEVLEKQGDAVRLALLDVVMPGMGGEQLYDIMRQKFPHIKALFGSGYPANSGESIHTGFILRDGLHFIAKPYMRKDLLRAIRALLDGEGRERRSKG